MFEKRISLEVRKDYISAKCRLPAKCCCVCRFQSRLHSIETHKPRRYFVCAQPDLREGMGRVVFGPTGQHGVCECQEEIERGSK